MLNQLTIRDYAIVDSLDMDFRAGMSVLTGETGAGKSIILGALGLTLGDRGDKSVVRTGSKRTEISAEFDLADNVRAQQWLQAQDLAEPGDDSGICLLRRLVTADGRSKAYINGTPVTLANLAELGHMLMDIHSQHEHQSLLRKSTHQRLLDEFGVKAGLLAQLRECWRQWQENRQLISKLSGQSEELTAQIQLVGYQVSELNELAPQQDESDQLEKEFKRLDSADSSLATLQQAVAICHGDDDQNISRSINQVQTLLSALPTRDSQLSSILELLNTAAIQIEEASAELQHSLDRIEINPERLEQVNQRLADLHQVARKHKIKPQELYQLHQDLQQQLDSYQNSDQELEKLQARDAALRTRYADLAGKLSQQRSQAAKKLSSQINTQLADLGMADARLEVQLTPSTSEDPAALGMETIEFLVSTNPGQPAKPLIKIASGGELSRISLAIQVITARTSKIPTLVFDEVDVGIGGGVAKAVGRLLRQLGEHSQILCVTHQAQVAGQGHQHYFVSKQSRGKTTSSTITELSETEKIKEVARMLGGEDFTDESLAHAQQMVANS